MMRKKIEKYIVKEILGRKDLIEAQKKYKVCARIVTSNSWTGIKIGEYEEEILANFMCPFEVTLAPKAGYVLLKGMSKDRADIIAEILTCQLDEDGFQQRWENM
jgi:hypothetical protein